MCDIYYKHDNLIKRDEWKSEWLVVSENFDVWCDTEEDAEFVADNFGDWCKKFANTKYITTE